jgi:hypothetical protein
MGNIFNSLKKVGGKRGVIKMLKVTSSKSKDFRGMIFHYKRFSDNSNYSVFYVCKEFPEKSYITLNQMKRELTKKG